MARERRRHGRTSRRDPERPLVAENPNSIARGTCAAGGLSEPISRHFARESLAARGESRAVRLVRIAASVLSRAFTRALVGVAAERLGIRLAVQHRNVSY